MLLKNWLVSSGLVLLLLWSCGPGDLEGEFAAAGGRQQINTVLWNANAEPDIAVYRVYRGFECSGTIVDMVAEVMATTFSESVPYRKHQVCYEITAVNTSGEESERSERVGKIWG